MTYNGWYAKKKKQKKKTANPNHIYFMYRYKEDLALNILQWLICHKLQPNQTISILYIYMYKEDLVLNNLQLLICNKSKPKLLNSALNNP